jgi:hypothetical protein
MDCSTETPSSQLQRRHRRRPCLLHGYRRFSLPRRIDVRESLATAGIDELVIDKQLRMLDLDVLDRLDILDIHGQQIRESCVLNES